MGRIVTRRKFLQGAMALSSLGLATRLSAMSATASAGAGEDDYKALVCVFMFGGNDGNNTVVPLDSAGYGSYSKVRTSSSGIQLAQSDLLPIQPLNGGFYGLHPSFTELQSLFTQKKMAILANVGTLTQPTTKLQYANGARPLSLYSHADQQAQWQSAISTGPSQTGWGGRLADQVTSFNSDSELPVITSLDGTVLFTTGAASIPLSIPVSGGFALQGFNGSAAANARIAAVKSLLAQSSSNIFVAAVNQTGNQALDLSAIVNPILTSASATVDPAFAGLTTSIAAQLHQVAKVIAARGSTGASRQIFFVQLGSFDTHGDQLNRQKALFDQLSPALKAFYDATVAAGVGDRVTTFTLSDFGRTFQPASGGGTDHAWGSHHFIMGDAVAGGNIFGTYPQLVLAGPDDAESEGRWVPTTSVDQYGATLASWFGVAPAALAKVFPNLASFPVANLGFLA
jgi:uncharacterized protein (DUF1501 family)